MTHSDLHQDLLEVLRNYWRIRNVIEFVRISELGQADVLIEYRGVDPVDGVPPFIANESFKLAIKAMHAHATQRMSSDYLLLLISKYEHFLSSKLKSIGQPGEGTLGQLQKATEKKFNVPNNSIKLASEVRERRNCLIHRNGQADQKYINAAADAALLSNGHIHTVALNSPISPGPEYLSFAADVLFQYSKAMP
ncbi:hypothetical protein [Melittangium boletus]|uniref:hypothetical protein n=1 Tax=Melittangium boletus TaxID=83453 RepID=UPI0012FD2CEE|nr:hypothetical protein [Melittangium boletus]